MLLYMITYALGEVKTRRVLPELVRNHSVRCRTSLTPEKELECACAYTWEPVSDTKGLGCGREVS